MSEFNEGQFNASQFTEGGFGPAPVLVAIPTDATPAVYSYPQVAVVSPIALPVLVVTNLAALLAIGNVGVLVFRNSVRLSEGTDFSRDSVAVTLTVAPTSADGITAVFYSTSNGTPLAPWSLRLSGPYDGVGVAYQIVPGPTLLGVVDGNNTSLSWGAPVKRIQVYLNDRALVVGTDYAPAQTAALFLASVPQSGDIVTVFGW